MNSGFLKKNSRIPLSRLPSVGWKQTESNLRAYLSFMVQLQQGDVVWVSNLVIFLSVKNRVSVRLTEDITRIFHLETILSFPFLETSAFIACRVLNASESHTDLSTPTGITNFFAFLLVQLFADFQFLAKLLVKEVPQVTERTNVVIICFHIRATSICAGCLTWSISIYTYLFIRLFVRSLVQFL